MNKFVLILGGSRSGKSSYAVELAKSSGKKVAFIATCVSPDIEMKKRIKRHQISRPLKWKLSEEGKDIRSALVSLENKYKIVLIDCLGLWISNLMSENFKDNEIEKEIGKISKILSEVQFTTILVSNEVGSGIVPDNSLGRRFRDLVGFANQIMAQYADEVIFMQAGIPIKIK